MEEILDAIKVCIIAVISGCISLKIASGTLFEITPAKLDLQKFLNKKSTLQKEIDELETNITELTELIKNLKQDVNDCSETILTASDEIIAANRKIALNSKRIEKLEKNQSYAYVAAKKGR